MSVLCVLYEVVITDINLVLKELLIYDHDLSNKETFP